MGDDRALVGISLDSSIEPCARQRPGNFCTNIVHRAEVLFAVRVFAFRQYSEQPDHTALPFKRHRQPGLETCLMQISHLLIVAAEGGYVVFAHAHPDFCADDLLLKATCEQYRCLRPPLGQTGAGRIVDPARLLICVDGGNRDRITLE